MKRFIIFIIFLLMHAPAFATQTILLKNQNAEKLTILFKNKAIKESARVENVTKTSLVVKAPIKSGFRQLLLSPQGMGNSAFVKYDLYFVQEDKDVIMSLTATTLSNDGSFTRFSYSWPECDEGHLLDKFKMMIEGYYTYNFDYIKKRKYLLSTVYNKECGIQPGDKVIAINGIDTKDVFKQYDRNLIFTPTKKDSVLQLKILRDDKIFETELKSVYIKPYTINPLF